MCLQCVVGSKIVVAEFLPGYLLAVATNNSSRDWPQHHFGLVEMNDPTFVFPPIPHPEDSRQRFIAMHERLSRKFYFHPVEGHRLVKACSRAGWRKRDGSLLWWLMLKIRKVIDASV